MHSTTATSRVKTNKTENSATTKCTSEVSEPLPSFLRALSVGGGIEEELFNFSKTSADVSSRGFPSMNVFYDRPKESAEPVCELLAESFGEMSYRDLSFGKINKQKE